MTSKLCLAAACARGMEVALRFRTGVSHETAARRDADPNTPYGFTTIRQETVKRGALVTKVGITAQ